MSRGPRGALVVRSRFVEDELPRRVAAGVRQYVLLGDAAARFDCIPAIGHSQSSMSDCFAPYPSSKVVIP